MVIGAVTVVVITTTIVVMATNNNNNKEVVIMLVISRVIRVGGREGNMRGIIGNRGHIKMHIYLHQIGIVLGDKGLIADCCNKIIAWNETIYQ